MEIFILVWVLFGVLTTTSSYAFAQKEWPYVAEGHRVKDSFFSLFFGLLGPIGLLSTTYASLSVCGKSPFKHGLKVPFTK